MRFIHALASPLPLLTLALAACASGPDAAPTPAPPHLDVDVYAATESSVNAYVVSDGAGTLIIDATHNAADGRQVAALARARGGATTTLLLTHGHPDHFLGMGALRAELPGLRIVVATEAIKQDVIGFATFMAAQGWLEQEPTMKPRTDANPDGFDYAGVIEVLDEPQLTLPRGAALQIRSDYAGAEAAHTSTVYSPELGALFAGDLAYHDVHLWLGVGVTRQSAADWQRIAGELEAEHGAKHTTIYPGHGAPTDASVFATDRAYIDDLLRVTAASASDEDAIAQMVALYPGYANREFLLMMSVQNLRSLAP